VESAPPLEKSSGAVTQEIAWLAHLHSRHPHRQSAYRQQEESEIEEPLRDRAARSTVCIADSPAQGSRSRQDNRATATTHNIMMQYIYIKMRR
jgi:hypothetical protein